jgi:hypothetical protein
MKPTDELIAANQEIRSLIESGPAARLRAIPGVVHVSVGLKQTARKTTDDLSISVYVRE